MIPKSQLISQNSAIYQYKDQLWNQKTIFFNYLLKNSFVFKIYLLIISKRYFEQFGEKFWFNKLSSSENNMS